MSNFGFLKDKKEYALFASAAIEAEKVYVSAPAMCAVGSRKALELRSVAAGTAAAIHSAGCSYAVSADPSFAGRYEQWAVESGRHHGVAAIG